MKNRKIKLVLTGYTIYSGGHNYPGYTICVTHSECCGITVVRRRRGCMKFTDANALMKVINEADNFDSAVNPDNWDTEVWYD
jgi:hypothetical protein